MILSQWTSSLPAVSKHYAAELDPSLLTVLTAATPRTLAKRSFSCLYKSCVVLASLQAHIMHGLHACHGSPETFPNEFR